jgi:membrane-associated phospholipid phosphatase
MHHRTSSANTDELCRFQLIYAAMPSLHFGNSLLLGTTLLLFSPHRLLRTLAPLWPAAMLLTIVVTANHYILDAVVGACIIGLAWRLNRVLLALRPLEEWGFWLCRADKPPRAPGRMATLDRDNERGIY